MRLYMNAYEMYEEVKRDLAEMGIEVHPKTMQDKNIEGNPDYYTKELQNYSYCLLDAKSQDIPGVSQPWADAEFNERVTDPWDRTPDGKVDPFSTPEYLNPGKAWELRKEVWTEYLHEGKMAYTYNELIWNNDQVTKVINRLKKAHHMSVIFITHDLGVVANMADRVAVMYAGKIVEYGKAEEVFYSPAHPYTWALLSSIPDIDSKEKLEAIPGTPPNMLFPPKGDAFAPRSKYAMGVDYKEEPPMFQITPTHYASTWLLDERAPKAEMPKIVSTRIRNSLAKHDKKEEK